MRRGMGTRSGCEFQFLKVIPAAVAFVGGIFIIAFGGLLRLFWSIEGNTYQLLEQGRDTDYRQTLAE